MSTYAQIVDMWEESRIALGDVERYHAKKSAGKARLFVPFFGDKDVSEISPDDIEKAIIALKENGSTKLKRGLSSSTLRYAYTHGKQAINWAISHGKEQSNPFSAVKKPKAVKVTARSLDNEQVIQLMQFMHKKLSEAIKANSLQNVSFCIAVFIAISTGIRRGEIFGLDWCDYDGVSISIKRSLKPDNHVGPPKTQSGIRCVSIGQNTAQILNSFKIWQSTRVPARKWNDPNLVMADANGKHLSMDAFERWWSKVRREAGFDGLKFHELRHTHASLLIASGTDIKTVQNRLGHSSADITMNIYAHALPRNDSRAAVFIDGLIKDNE